MRTSSLPFHLCIGKIVFNAWYVFAFNDIDVKKTSTRAVWVTAIMATISRRFLIVAEHQTKQYDWFVVHFRWRLWKFKYVVWIELYPCFTTFRFLQKLLIRLSFWNRFNCVKNPFSLWDYAYLKSREYKKRSTEYSWIFAFFSITKALGRPLGIIEISKSIPANNNEITKWDVYKQGWVNIYLFCPQ